MVMRGMPVYDAGPVMGQHSIHFHCTNGMGECAAQFTDSFTPNFLEGKLFIMIIQQYTGKLNKQNVLILAGALLFIGCAEEGHEFSPGDIGWAENIPKIIGRAG